MSESDVENRISALEREVANLKSKVRPSDSNTPWWERIAGRFIGDSLYEEAMKEGRSYRNTDRRSADSQEPS
jgi:hypothetical protein